ncbi:TetR family transcriptional regulator [Leifsonia sp. ZF2019]|uniref:TetR/AcrR family transcriptional regulator n=1 Tax=Leifsonia sp. ZF2019 TaxID=2781978 RepID=UPI001CBBD03B|nr:TetR family transcriptional regulator C-terminal domain-containing protein [Leifsonia sp. ZF2019]UAJ78503.1 TetR family transcriptional regulator [Leifsonia sp. ZF2019]
MPRTIDHDARKADLAQAVWRVIADRGLGAVSVRTVAAEAKVAVGSLRHLFPTRTELIEFSAELMVERVTDRIQALPRRADTREYALDVLAELLPLTADGRAELEVNIALIAEAPAVPGLARIRDIADQALSRACLHLVRLLRREAGTEGADAEGADADGDDTGADAADRERALGTDALRLHALVDGLALHLLVRDGSPEWALDILRAEVDRLAA